MLDVPHWVVDETKKKESLFRATPFFCEEDVKREKESLLLFIRYLNCKRRKIVKPKTFALGECKKKKSCTDRDELIDNVTLYTGVKNSPKCLRLLFLPSSWSGSIFCISNIYSAGRLPNLDDLWRNEWTYFVKLEEEDKKKPFYKFPPENCWEKWKKKNDEIIKSNEFEEFTDDVIQ